MPATFMAQSLAETRTKNEERRFELTFLNAKGERQTISLPVGVVSDLVPVLQSLAGHCSSRTIEFTRLPKSTAVGSARHERLVLIRFDDEPPYGLDVEDADNLWRQVREEAEHVSRIRPPPRQ
jgi:hypothetical protein